MAKYRARRTSLIGGRLLHHRHNQTPLGAGWSSPVARQAHNLKVVGSNPTPATKIKARCANALAGIFMCKFAKFRPPARIPPNAIEIKGFLSRIIWYWHVHVTWLAHGMRLFVRQPFRDYPRTYFFQKSLNRVGDNSV